MHWREAPGRCRDGGAVLAGVGASARRPAAALAGNRMYSQARAARPPQSAGRGPPLRGRKTRRHHARRCWLQWILVLGRAKRALLALRLVNEQLIGLLSPWNSERCRVARLGWPHPFIAPRWFPRANRARRHSSADISAGGLGGVSAAPRGLRSAVCLLLLGHRRRAIGISHSVRLRVARTDRLWHRPRRIWNQISYAYSKSCGSAHWI